MSHAYIIDGKAIAAKVRADVAADVARMKAQHGFAPGLAVVLVGEDPASKVYVRNKAEQTVEVGMQSFEHKLPAETTEAALLDLVAAPQRRSGRARHPRADAAAQAHRQREGAGGDRSGQGRRRLPPRQRRPALDRRARAGAVHAGRLDHPCKVGEARSVGPRRGRRRPLQHRRQADGAAAAARELHGDHRAFAHQEPARRRAPRRPRGGGDRQARDRQGRLDQARRHRDRRRHQPHRQAGRQGQARRRRGLRRGGRRWRARSRRCRAASGR